jgi:Zn ribbon nucleic-acid-binding protein
MSPNQVACPQCQRLLQIHQSAAQNHPAVKCMHCGYVVTLPGAKSASGKQKQQPTPVSPVIADDEFPEELPQSPGRNKSRRATKLRSGGMSKGLPFIILGGVLASSAAVLIAILIWKFPPQVVAPRDALSKDPEIRALQIAKDEITQLEEQIRTLQATLNTEAQQLAQLQQELKVVQEAHRGPHAQYLQLTTSAWETAASE